MKNNENPKFDVLNAISVLTKKLANSKLKVKRTQEFTKAEEHLNEYFGTTSGGTWMLCAMISYYFDNRGDVCNFNNLANFFYCPVMSTMAYKKDIETLLTKKYIRNTRTAIDDEIGLQNEFEISNELLNAVLHNKKIIITKNEAAEKNLLNMIKKLADVVGSSQALYEKKAQIEHLETKYVDEKFVKDIKSLIPRDIHARMFFYDACNNFLEGYSTGLNRTINDAYDPLLKFGVAESFMNETHVLIKYDLLEFTEKGNLTDSVFEITQKAKEMLLGENAKLFTNMASGTNIIQPDKIVAKELFYSLENQSEIERLTSSLHKENLKSIQERLAEKGLPKGIAVLLYGAPGTGKTESVYQIAKTTGRRILHVDISSAKSAWFGQSEKIVKKIFTDYKNLCKACKNEKDGKMPILLFNEADGILSKRKDVSSGNVAQTENAIQNIILEEMEKLEGIMIATTNLADNLDAAFERRFLFKIKFENPSVDAKKKIWKSKLNWLSESDLSAFAQDYDLSGGQIDNIVRKITMDEVLTGRRPNFEELRNLCKNEKLGSTEKRIGFF
ncbi:MAG: ATP-binding protein [Spirochaetaceae bacterium]|nr:ATP-binding protein [Spirochaetaceae bacterium]